MNAPAPKPERLPYGVAPKVTPELIDELQITVDVARALGIDAEDRAAERAIAKLCDSFDLLLELLKRSRARAAKPSPR